MIARRIDFWEEGFRAAIIINFIISKIVIRFYAGTQ
jgi:hypothetical protein